MLRKHTLSGTCMVGWLVPSVKCGQVRLCSVVARTTVPLTAPSPGANVFRHKFSCGSHIPASVCGVEDITVTISFRAFPFRETPKTAGPGEWSTHSATEHLAAQSWRVVSHSPAAHAAAMSAAASAECRRNCACGASAAMQCRGPQLSAGGSSPSVALANTRFCSQFGIVSKAALQYDGIFILPDVMSAGIILSGPVLQAVTSWHRRRSSATRQ